MRTIAACATTAVVMLTLRPGALAAAEPESEIALAATAEAGPAVGVTILRTSPSSFHPGTFGLAALSLQWRFRDFWTVGPVVTVFRSHLPEGDAWIGVVRGRADVRLLGQALPDLPIRVGAALGLSVGNGGAKTNVGAHLSVAYPVTTGVSLFVRGEYNWLSVRYGRDCPAVSPVAGCEYRAELLIATLGLEYGN